MLLSQEKLERLQQLWIAVDDYLKSLLPIVESEVIGLDNRKIRFMKFKGKWQTVIEPVEGSNAEDDWIPINSAAVTERVNWVAFIPALEKAVIASSELSDEQVTKAIEQLETYLSNK